MSDKKQLVILYAILVAVIVGGTIWMSHEIDRRLELQKPTSSVNVQTFCNGGLTPEPTFCQDSSKNVLHVSVARPTVQSMHVCTQNGVTWAQEELCVSVAPAQNNVKVVSQ